jgi:hypothetical protein
LANDGNAINNRIQATATQQSDGFDLEFTSVGAQEHIRYRAYKLGNNDQVDIGFENLGTSDGTRSVNVGFEPDFVRFWANPRLSTGSETVQDGNDWGMANGWLGRNDQFAMAFTSYSDNVDDHVWSGRDDQCLAVQHASSKGGSTGLTDATGSLTSSGFDLDVTTSGDGTSDNELYLYVALQMEGGFSLAKINAQESTGADTVKGKFDNIEFVGNATIDTLDNKDGYSGSNQDEISYGWSHGTATSPASADQGVLSIGASSNSINEHRWFANASQAIRILFTDQNANDDGSEDANFDEESAESIDVSWTEAATSSGGVLAASHDTNSVVLWGVNSEVGSAGPDFAVHKNQEETSGFFDALQTTKTLSQALDETVAVVTEAVDTVATFKRSFGEVMGLAGTATAGARFTQFQRETVSVEDTVATAPIFGQPLSETVAVADQFASTGTFKEAIAEAVAMAETTTPGLRVTQTLSETIDVADAFFRNVIEGPIVDLIVHKQQEETVDVVETVALTLVGLITQTLVETVDVTEDVANSGLFFQALDETFDVVKTVQTSASITESIDETVAVIDDATTIATLTQTLNELVAVAEETNLGIDVVIMEALAGIENVTQLGVSKRLSQTVDVAEEVATFASITQALSETVDVAETVVTAATYRQAFAETVDVVETARATATFRQTLSELAGIVKAVETTKGLTATLSETVAVVEAAATSASFSRSFTETVDVVEAVVPGAQRVASLSETLDVAEAIATPVGYSRSLDESVDVADDVAASGLFFQAFDETLAVVESVQSSASIMKFIDETVAVTYDATTSATLTRTFDEVVTVVEKTNLAIDVVIMEALAGIENVTQLGVSKRLSETVDVAKEVATVASVTQAISETVDVAEAVATAATLTRTFDEVIAVAEETNLGVDVVIMEALAGIENVTELGVTKPLSATMDVAEEVATVASITQAISETVDVAEAVATVATLTRTFDEVIDVVEETNLAIDVVIMEALAGIENVTQLGVSKRLSQTVDVAEEVATAATITQGLSETVDVAEAVARSVGYSRSLNEIADVAEAVATRGTFSQSFSEVVEVVETVRATKGLTAILSETVAVAETAATSGSFSRSFTETVDVVKTVVPGVRQVAALSETVDVADAVATSVGYSRSLDEIVKVAEAVATQGTFNRSFSEVVDVVGTVRASSGITMALVETVDVADTVATRATLTRTFDEVVAVVKDTNLAIDVVIMEAVAGIENVAELGVMKSLSETTAVVKTLETAATLRRTFSEVVDVAEATNLGIDVVFMEAVAGIENVAELGVAKSLSETAAVVETLQTVSILRQTIAEVVDVAETAVTAGSFSRVFEETVAVADTLAQRLLEQAVTLSETMDVAEEVAASAAFVRVFAETVDVEVVFPQSLTVTLSETLDVSERTINRGSAVMTDAGKEAWKAAGRLWRLIDIRDRRR